MDIVKSEDSVVHFDEKVKVLFGDDEEMLTALKWSNGQPRDRARSFNDEGMRMSLHKDSSKVHSRHRRTSSTPPSLRSVSQSDMDALTTLQSVSQDEAVSMSIANNPTDDSSHVSYSTASSSHFVSTPAEADFSAFSYQVLRDLCKMLGLKSNGRKELLVSRLKKSIAIRKEVKSGSKGSSPGSDSKEHAKRSLERMEQEDKESLKKAKVDNGNPPDVEMADPSEVNGKGSVEEDLPAEEAHDAVLAAGVTHVPNAVESEGFEIAELHEYDFQTRAWKSPSMLIRIKIEKKHFQEGALRRAFMASVLERPGVKFVVKDYKDKDVEPRILYKDVQMQIACKYYARALNKHIETLVQPDNLAALPSVHQRTLTQCHPLQFADSFLIKIPESSASVPSSPSSSTTDSIEEKKERLYVGEYFIEGDYRKYNNNWGYVAKQSDFMNDYAQAFSHFTLETSKGEVLICDLQGTNEQFTDPQIHTT
jgi:hypothetical protein